MSKLTTSEAAQRLADALLADIRLYNAAKIARGGDLSEEVQEGRALFQSRVLPQWHAVFEQTMANGLTVQPSAGAPRETPTAKSVDALSKTAPAGAVPVNALAATPPSVRWIMVGLGCLVALVAWAFSR